MMHPLLLKLFPERCAEHRNQQGMTGDGPMHASDRLQHAMMGELSYFPNQLPPPPQPYVNMHHDRQVMHHRTFGKKSGQGDRGFYEDPRKIYRNHGDVFFQPFGYQQQNQPPYVPPPANMKRSKQILKEVADIAIPSSHKEEKHSKVLAEATIDGGAKVISYVDVEGTRRVRIEYDRKSMLEASQSPFARIAPSCMRNVVMKMPEIVPKFPRAFNAKEYEKNRHH
ncbi:unnamed protein product, partial [Mesorhabditis belari]|uniref:Uncharacterized protein n=1 Tax=Mesorhabditis belari TaxID=2138241 RepID=A0AAF3FEN0_9BILA